MNKVVDTYMIEEVLNAVYQEPALYTAVHHKPGILVSM